MHGIVAQNVDKYIESNPQLEKYFKRLKDANKQLFLVTNSPYHFVYVHSNNFGLDLSHFFFQLYFHFP